MDNKAIIAGLVGLLIGLLIGFLCWGNDATPVPPEGDTRGDDWPGSVHCPPNDPGAPTAEELLTAIKVKAIAQNQAEVASLAQMRLSTPYPEEMWEFYATHVKNAHQIAHPQGGPQAMVDWTLCKQELELDP